jgi:hypothetical protein
MMLPVDVERVWTVLGATLALAGAATRRIPASDTIREGGKL